LAATLKVGTRSIREALQRLETRGMIDIVHGKGSFVAKRNVETYAAHLIQSFRFLHDDEQRLLREIGYIRRIIELAAIHHATKSSESAIVSELESLLAQLADAKSKVDVERYNELDLEFHRHIVQSTGNSLLLALYDNLRGLLAKIFAGTGHIAGALERSSAQHKNIVESIKSKDPKRARKALADHLASTARDVEAALKNTGDT